MENLIKKICDTGMSKLMEHSRETLLEKNQTYLNDKKDLVEMEKRYMALDLSKSQRLLINDYIAIMQSSDSIYADVSYFAGVKDTITLLSYFGLINNDIERNLNFILK